MVKIRSLLILENEYNKECIWIGKLVQVHVLVIWFYLLLDTDLVVEFEELDKTL